MIKKILKNTPVSLLFLLISVLFYSCSFFQENKTAEVSFSIGNLNQNNSRAAYISNTDFVEVTLLGDYTETQTINYQKDAKIIFAEVPLEASVYAEVYIYRLTALQKRQDKYYGKSEPVIVQEGENHLKVILKSTDGSSQGNNDNPDNPDDPVPATANYKVKHILQNIEDDDYSEVFDIEEKTGKVGTETEAEAKTYTGFIAKAVEQKTIAEDGSTIVEIKYDRKTYTIKYEDSISDEAITVPEDSNTYRYGAKVPVIFDGIGNRTGYTFKSWTNMDTGAIYSIDISTMFEMGDGDVTLYAQWEANTYSITYELNGGEWADGYTAPDKYTYGEGTTLPNADKTLLAGYGLAGWYLEPDYSGNSLTEISPDTTGNLTLHAQWIAGATYYTVHHWLQNLENDDYTEAVDDKQTLSGISDTSTTAVAYTKYTGFSAKSIEQKDIAGDGSTEVSIYYDRNKYTVTYEDGKDSVVIVPDYSPEDIPVAAEYKYGTSVTIDSTIPTYTGYSFDTWTDAGGINYSAGDTFVIENNVTITAKWRATAVRYTVIYLLKNLDGTYMEAERTQPSQTTGLETIPETPNFSGYGEPVYTPQIVQPDGSTTVEVKYDRLKFTITFDENANGATVNNMATDTTEYSYEEKITIPSVTPTRIGYTFKGWSTENPAISTTTLYHAGDEGPAMSDSGLTLYAQWEDETQETNIEAQIIIDTTTITVTESAGIFTATTGYSSYSWNVDGEEAATAYLDPSNPNKLDLSSITVSGVYDITLTATKTVSGSTVTHTWTGQFIK